MIKFLIVILVMCMPIFSFAQRDDETGRLLKAAADKALAYKTVNTKFELVVSNIQDKSEQKFDGKLWVKGDKFKMTMSQSVTFCDGKSRWV